MTKAPHLLLLAGLLGAACDDTVALNEPDQGSGGDAGSENAGGSPGSSGKVGNAGGDAGANATGGSLSPTGGSAGASGPDDGGSAGSGTGVDGGGGVGGENGMGPTYPAICSTAAGDPVVGGARLKAMCVQAADGSQILRRGRLFDSELGSECKYHLAADGTRRCLPILDPAASIAANTGFTNATCTERVAIFDFGCAEALPEYVYVLEDVPFCSHETEPTYRAHVFALGGFVQPAQLYAKSGDDCVAAGLPLNKAIYAVSPVPAASFVEGTRSLAP